MELRNHVLGYGTDPPSKEETMFSGGGHLPGISGPGQSYSVSSSSDAAFAVSTAYLVPLGLYFGL